MGKWTDKLYITHSEWSNKFSEGGMNFGGKKDGSTSGKGGKVLPFKCCALSQTPFKNPVCTQDGAIFEYENIIEFLRQYRLNPISGLKLRSKDLIKLHVSFDEQDECICPISNKPFTGSTKVVAIRNTGNVYSYTAVEEFNLKAKNLTDLINGEPFKKSDIIVLFDPSDLSQRTIQDFYYIKRSINFRPPEKNRHDKHKAQTTGENINASKSVERVLAEVKAKSGKLEAQNDRESKTHATQTLSTGANTSTNNKAGKEYNASNYSKGRVAASLTSTAMDPVTVNESVLQSELEYMLPKIKTQTFAVLKTNYGDLNLVLNSSKFPQTCYNFVQLANTGCLNNIDFISSIRNLVLMADDPTERLKNVNQKKKYDILSTREVRDRISQEKSIEQSHNKRGLISMIVSELGLAFQFFITYRPSDQFDGQHIIFGQVVGGLENLDKIELVPVDNESYTPKSRITIEKTVILVDPYQEFSDRLDRKLKYTNNSSIDPPKTKGGNKNLSSTTNWFGRKV